MSSQLQAAAMILTRSLVLYNLLDESACFKPNSITLASSELAPNMFGASSELASVMEFGFLRFLTKLTCLSVAERTRDALRHLTVALNSGLCGG